MQSAQYVYIYMRKCSYINNTDIPTCQCLSVAGCVDQMPTYFKQAYFIEIIRDS